MHKVHFGRGSAPNPVGGGGLSLRRSPRPLVGWYLLYFPENARILHDKSPKNIFDFFFWGGGAEPPPFPTPTGCDRAARQWFPGPRCGSRRACKSLVKLDHIWNIVRNQHLLRTQKLLEVKRRTTKLNEWMITHIYIAPVKHVFRGTGHRAQEKRL